MPTVKSVKKTSSRSKPSRSKTSVKRSSKPKSLKKSLNLRTTLAFFGIVIIALLAGYLVFKFNQSPLDTMVVRTNTFTYISNYNWDRLLECSKKADTDSTKSTCYRNALNRTYSTSTLSIDSLRNKNYLYMREFLRMYGDTNFRNWRDYFWGDSSKTDLQYYRTLCNTGATKAMDMQVRGVTSTTEWLNLTNRLMAAFDEYDQYWGKSHVNWDWNTPVAAYDCGVFASIMWNKIQPDVSRPVDVKKALIRSKLIHRADYILSTQNAGIFPSIHRITVAGDPANNIPGGNAQGEEAAWTAAFLNLMYYLYPIAPNAQNYRKNAIWLSDFSQTMCTDTLSCVFDMNSGKEYGMINHGIYGHPQYGLAVLGNNARAGLIDYTFASTRDRNAIPINFRVQTKSPYNFVNIFERQVSKIYKEDFGFKYPFTIIEDNYWELEGISDCYDFTYMGTRGVCETGVRADFNSPLAFNYSYILDLYNSNGYRSIDGSTAKFYEYEDAALTAGKLYWPAVYSGGTWNYTPLTMAKNAYSPWGRKFITHSEYNSLYDNKTNWNFFVNSMKAFEHTLSAIILSPGYTPLQRLY